MATSELAHTRSSTSTTRFLEAAKDFSFEQKLSVVQSVLGAIPREQQQPWNIPSTSSKSSGTDDRLQAISTSGPTSSSTLGSTQEYTLDVQRAEAASANEDDSDLCSHSSEKFKSQAPPLIDPYEKSMKFYEKHLVLNHFQHMTAKLVLQRPENTLQFMVDWCKDMQKKQAENQLKSKTLYEGNKIDVYEDDGGPDVHQRVSTVAKSGDKDTLYGNSSLMSTRATYLDKQPKELATDIDLSNKLSSQSFTDSGIEPTENAVTHRKRLETTGSEDGVSVSTADDDTVSVSTASETDLA